MVGDAAYCTISAITVEQLNRNCLLFAFFCLQMHEYNSRCSQLEPKSLLRSFK